MSRRTLVLLIVAIAVWIFAIYFLLFSPWGVRSQKIVIPSPKKPPKTVSIEKTPLTSKILDDYTAIVDEGLRDGIDMFKPKKLGLSPSELNELIMKSKNSLPNIEFVGYIIGDKGGEIFLKIKSRGENRNSQVRVFHRNDLIEGRYLVIHTSSLGLVVLDLEEGGLETIK